VFYDQLGLAQSLAPKKKLRFKDKLLSLDASFIDLCLSTLAHVVYLPSKRKVQSFDSIVSKIEQLRFCRLMNLGVRDFITHFLQRVVFCFAARKLSSLPRRRQE
jgi:hypothetical protein